MIIKSSTTLRNDYGKISTLAHEVEEPIYITKNGEGNIVVMSIEAFEKREQLLKLKVKLAMAEQSRLLENRMFHWKMQKKIRGEIKEKHYRGRQHELHRIYSRSTKIPFRKQIQ